MNNDDLSHVRVPLVPLPENTIPGARPYAFDPDAAFEQEEASSSYGIGNGYSHQRRRSTIKRVFQRGHDIESSRVNHHFTREERERLKDFESIDYLAANSEVYRQWVSSQPYRRTWDRWFMMGSIGATVGLLGYALYTLIDQLAWCKYWFTRKLVDHTNPGVAWLANVAYSTGLVFVSSVSVVWGAPAAAGAGVAEVMAYLNGCNIPRIFNIRTFLVKFVSCACAVASGMPVGPEGPMVHLGALIGAAYSQGHSTTLQCSTGLFTRFRNPKDKRDFVTAGAAVGIATAFGAPIGGLLFVFEEVASFWQHELGWQIFFACMLAVLALDTLRSAENTLLFGDVFGLFKGSASTVLYEVDTPLTSHVAIIGPSALIGVLCGLCGSAFTIINVKIARLRHEIIGDKKWYRVLEPCVIIVVFVTLAMVVPLLFPCTPIHCFVAEGHTTEECLVEKSLELYTCSHDHLHINTSTSGNSTQLPKSYNQLATLMSVPGEGAIRHLLTRGTHRQFGYATLSIMLAVYSLAASWAAGSAIASGLFVPMLLIGSCVGRLVGLLTVDVVAKFGGGSLGAPPGVFLPPSPWSWIDPGAFALVGAGAFMGGVTRLTVSVAVIIMEVSNDVRMLIPTLVGILVAKWVADAIAHPLYHTVLEGKCVPFLPRQPISKQSLDLVEIRHLMSYPVITLKETMKISDIRDALRNGKHNGFPVVRDTSHGQVFVGLVTRDHLMVLLRRAVGLGSTHNLQVPYTELNRQFVSKQALELVSRQTVAVLEGTPMGGFPGISGHLLQDTLDLRPYINNSAFKVQETFSTERAYILFSTMGLRHLVVVDEHNHVKGIITRKDLLGYKLDEAVDRSRGIAILPRPLSDASMDEW